MKPLNQYQHYIPRFILRAFQESDPPAFPSLPASNKKKKRVVQKQRLTEAIHRYDLSTEEYDPSSLVSRSYGFANLYRDTNNDANMNHIEDKFGKLESDAARILKYVKDNIDNRRQNVDLLRKDLYTLRKFLFLLHLRTKKRSTTYFQEDHPDNVRLRGWIQKQKTLHDLPSDMHLWLNGLDYYLETPVDQILEDAKQDAKTVSEMFSMAFNPDHCMNPDTDLKRYHAQAYEGFHNWYYLSICKAAPSSEFVLGDNSFGLWEGTVGGEGGQVHRIYVISPQVAIILRLNMTKDHMFSMMMVNSILNDVAFSPPVTRYIAPMYMGHFVPSFSPNDSFTLKVHQLTKSQTYKVNEIVLENLHEDGTLTFASEDIMLTTLAEYDSPNGSFAKPRRAALRKLKDSLSQRIHSRGRPNPTPPNPSGSGAYPPAPTTPGAMGVMPAPGPFDINFGVSVNQTDDTEYLGTGSATRTQDHLQPHDNMDSGGPDAMEGRMPVSSGVARRVQVIDAVNIDEDTSLVAAASPQSIGAFYSPESTPQHVSEASESAQQEPFPPTTRHDTPRETPQQARGETTSFDSSAPPDTRTLLPETSADRDFLRILTEALDEDDEGESIGLRCLKVWKAATTKEEINHPFALKIRCRLAESIKRCTDHPLGPWFPRYTTNKKSLHLALSPKEYTYLFSLAVPVIGVDYGLRVSDPGAEPEETRILIGAVFCGFLEWYSSQFCLWFTFQCIIHPMTSFPPYTYVYPPIIGKLADNMRFTSMARASLYHFLQFVWCAWRLTHNPNQVITLVLTCTSTFYRARDFVLVLLAFQFCDWSFKHEYQPELAALVAFVTLAKGVREFARWKQESQLSSLMRLAGEPRPEDRRA
ncbi:hypothetical protein P691DRAFT_778255 [Macrolepiota fuliginosa MF-IS2]|uniref:Uncharacterized protein n=1 Tax=Macrolepiota fuliginosa MF-IS2 TaxID=1400762 RepID=A0A9P5X7Y0_9AGAR|nr:hypothetical protein P691DRAFT_778255 [Macrolepiota fuliginosa MF-IS2]